MNSTQSGFLDKTNHVSKNRVELVFLKLKPLSDSCISERLKHSLMYRAGGKVELYYAEGQGEEKLFEWY